MSRPKHDIEELKAGAQSLACTRYILELEAVNYESLVIELAFERMERKCNEVLELFNASGKNWNQTFYTMLFRVLGGMDNRQAMIELSKRVKYHVLMRENSSIVYLEALLLGGAGLLELYPTDSYIHRLRVEFEHLATKYEIVPMKASEWNLNNRYRHNHPTLRITQIAACLHNKDFNIERALSFNSGEQIYDLFSGKASQYWVENFTPNTSSATINSRIGHLKSDLLSINLIAPMMFAYGNYTCNSDMTTSAVELLEDVVAEHNRYTNPWYSAGVEPRDALVSQALLQLSKEYCTPRRCGECPLAKMLTRG